MCHASLLPVLFWYQQEIRFFFRVSLGFVFLFDQSAGSHIICRTSVAGNSNGEGVVLT